MTRLDGMMGTLATCVVGLGLAAGASAQTSTDKYAVIINHEEQYSIWPIDLSIEKGWRPVGITCTKDQCLRQIEELWTDMRPLSIRCRIEADLKRAQKIRADGN